MRGGRTRRNRLAMGKDNTSLMTALLRRLRTETNGAVSGAMEQGGIKYGINYGVSIPAVKNIAGEYGTNHSLALLLFGQDVRELKLAALFIDNPLQVTASQMREWSKSFTNTEIIDQTAMRLFSKAAPAFEVASEWMSDGDGLVRYAGFMTAAGAIKNQAANAGDEFRDKVDFIVDSADKSIARMGVDRITASAAIILFANAAKVSAETGQKVGKIISGYILSGDALVRHIGTETEWLISSGSFK